MPHGLVKRRFKISRFHANSAKIMSRFRERAIARAPEIHG